MTNSTAILNKSSLTMIRRTFTMNLNPDALEEYREHHDTWPETRPQLFSQIRDSGMAENATFQDERDIRSTAGVKWHPNPSGPPC